MNLDEIYQLVKTNKPRLTYLSGKTSTGKSTFSRKLVQDFGYKVIELDQLVQSSVIKQFKLTDEGTTFVEVYRGRDKKLWIQEFVKDTRNFIEKHLKNGEYLIIEGAVANPITLSELFDGHPDPIFIYFNPSNIDSYIRNLTNRFMTTSEQKNGSLPAAFWELVDKSEFRTFCKNRVLSENLTQSIRKYAFLSQEESDKRLKKFQEYFEDIKVVEI